MVGKEKTRQCGLLEGVEFELMILRKTGYLMSNGSPGFIFVFMFLAVCEAYLGHFKETYCRDFIEQPIPNFCCLLHGH